MEYEYAAEATLLRRRNRQRFCYILCGGLIFGCFLLLHIFWCNESSGFTSGGIFQYGAEREQLSESNLVIQQPGCRIPSMSVMGPMVKPYISKEASIFCDAPEYGKEKGAVFWQPILIRDSEDAIYVDPASLELSGQQNVQCIYKSFQRASVTPGKERVEELDRKPPVFSHEVKHLNLTGKNLIQSESEEFIKVECSVPKAPQNEKKKKKRRKPFYVDYFSFVPPKKEVEERCNRLNQNQDENWVNVAIIGLDALSRLNFQRQMPSSHSYLIDQMGAIEMYGFNKVGDNTFPNLVPTLMNLSEDEVQKVCWPDNDSFFDKCPFIWNQYRDRGYRTAFVEDTPMIAAFNYLKNGFHTQPTDYYPRPWFYEAETHIGRHFSGNCYLCLGPRLSLSAILDYTYKFFQTFHSKKFFGFFWSTSFTHDYMNLPSQGDEAVFNFLHRLRENQLLNRTVLIVLSDHGLRWGDYRNTFQGHLEERLPLLMFTFPPWFETLYPQAVRNLRQNAHKLTTHYDLHHTMVDLLNLTALQDGILQQRANQTGRGQSLFQPISPHRNCSQAGIPRHYCTCHDSIEKMNTNDSRVVAAAEAVAKYMNNLLKTEPYCAHLQVKSIKQATMEMTTMNGTFASANTNSEYLITVEMHPGNGLFEATVLYDSWFKTYSVIGRVSRINLYGAQSFCVHDNILKLYCYCKH